MPRSPFAQTPQTRLFPARDTKDIYFQLKLRSEAEGRLTVAGERAQSGFRAR